MPENNDPFAECFALPHEAILFVPSTFEVNKVDHVLQREVLDYIESELSSAYGGATENAPCSGKWMSPEKGLVSEQVVPVTCYLSELSHDVKTHILRLARYIRDTMRQESVLFVVDGQARLV